MNTLAQGKTGNVRWQALPDWEPLLFGPQGLRLTQWCAETRVQVVKHGPHRTVYYVELPERAFYVKHYRCSRWLQSARHLFRASAARREWDKVTEIARRGIPTVKPVAWVEQLGGGIVGDNYFITESIPDCCSLEHYVLKQLPRLPVPTREAMWRQVLDGLARFVAAVHQAGILHNDFHAGNVLLRLGPGHAENGLPDGPVELYLIDVPGVRFSSPPKWPASRESLIMLNSAWWHKMTPGQRLQFWQTYLAERPELDAPDRQTAIDQLDDGSRKYAQRCLRHRDKRALRNNRDYVALRHRRGQAHGVHDLAESELKRLLDDPETLLWRNLQRPVKLDLGTMAVEAELPVAGREVHVLYKRYRPRNWWKALLGIFRRGRALRGWYLGHALLKRQIATARPLAVCDVRRPRCRAQSYLAIEWIEGSENLHLFGWRLARRPLGERLRRAARCAESLGALIGRLHAWQIVHGDLNASNLLAVERDQEVQTYLIDADDVRIANRLTSSHRAADLARLATSVQAHPWITRSIHCRFFQAYVRQFPPDTVDWKPLWHEVARRSRQITHRKRRRRKPIL